MHDRFPLVHLKISEARSEAWITCFSAYPDDCENLADDDENEPLGASRVVPKSRLDKSISNSTGSG
jgi:hypothetical protein